MRTVSGLRFTYYRRRHRTARRGSDAVVLHVWQAVRIVIDLGLSACLHCNLGTPES
jgi:hypothetical protein